MRLQKGALPVVTVSAFVLAACDIPRDPNHTLARVQHYRQVRVGLSESPPWVVRTSGEPAGAEVQLIREFTTQIGAQPVWIWGSEQQHIQALERFELDLAAGGIDGSTAWKKKVGLTRPYFEERIAVGMPPSMEPPYSLEGVKVFVKDGDPAAALLRSKHASPQRIAELKSVAGPIAAPEWKIEQLGFRASKFTLQQRGHVIATPPGENGWIKRLEEFLFSRQAEIKPLLEREAVSR